MAAVVQFPRGVAPAAPLPALLAPDLPAAQPGDTLSASQVGTFIGCAAAWAFAKIDKLPDPPTATQSLGSAIHEAVLDVNFSQKVRTGRDLPSADVVDAFRKSWEKRLDETTFRDSDSPDQFEQQGIGLVQKYMSDAAPWIRPVAVEQSIEGKIAGVRVRARIDLIEEDGRVVELKTSSRSSSSIRPDHLFQLSTYDTLSKQANGQVRVDLLVRNKTPKLVQIRQDITAPSHQWVQRVYPAAQKAMRSGVYLPNRSSYLCSRTQCSFWRACEARWGGKVAGGTEEE